MGKWIFEKITSCNEPEKEIPLSPFPIKQPVVYHFNPVAFVEQMRKLEEEYKWARSEFGNLIAKNESNNNYNICNNISTGVLKVVSNLDVVNCTIKEIRNKQKANDIFAVGRYQIIPITLDAAIDKLVLDVESKLDENMQDRIFEKYLISLKRPAIINYLEGNGDIHEAMYLAAKEWASIGVEKGKVISKKRIAMGGESYYAGDGLNKAHITPTEIKEVLEKSRKKYN